MLEVFKGFCRTCSVCLSLALLLVLSATLLLSSSISAGTTAEYHYDDVGNIVSIQRTDTTLNISSFSPTFGPEGAEIFIYGSGFNVNPSGNAVFFNGVQSEVSYASSSLLVTQVPVGATTGLINVDVGVSTAISSTVFTVTSQYAEPEIENFSPTCGTVGTVVTVQGKNFALGATQAGVSNTLTNANVVNSKPTRLVLELRRTIRKVRSERESERNRIVCLQPPIPRTILR